MLGYLGAAGDRKILALRYPGRYLGIAGDRKILAHKGRYIGLGT